MSLVSLASSIASHAHLGMVDRAGVDYYSGHVCHVASSVSSRGDEFVACALLHDVIEDCDVSSADLLSLGVPPAVVSAVVAMSKIDGEPYSDYLDRVKSDPIARVVKIADLLHNMDLSRLPSVSSSDHARVEKYRAALSFLSE